MPESRNSQQKRDEELEALRAQVAALHAAEAQRERAEAALRESESRYKAILAGIADGYYEVDLAGNFTFFNDALCRMFGVTRDDLADMNYREYTSEEDARDVYAVFNQVYKSGQASRGYSWEIRRRDGTVSVVEVSISRMTDPDGEPVGFRGLVRDVTERVRTDQRLRDAADRLDGIVSTATDAIITIDADQNITLFNAAAEQLFGYKASQVLGRSIGVLVPARHREAHHEHIREFGRSGTTARSMSEPGWVSGLRADGTEFPIEALISQTVVSDERLFTIILRDVSERLLAEQAEKERRSLAESLRDTASALNSTLDVSEVLDRILTSAGRVLPHDAAEIMLVNPEKKSAHIVRQHVQLVSGDKPEGSWLERDFPLSELSNLHRMSQTSLPMTIADLEADPNWVVFPGTEWARSYVGAPIRLEGEVIGFLALLSATPNRYSDMHAGHLQAFADQAAVAFRNARLYQQVQRHAVQLESLRRVTLNITAELDLDALLYTLARSVFSLLDADGGGIYLYRPARDVLEWTVSVGPGLAPPGTELKRGEGLSGKVWDSGKPLIVGDYSNWDGRASIYDDFHYGSVVGVPIVWGDELLGVFNATIDRPEAFTDREVELLTLFAAQAAIAIHNARLFDDVRQHAARLEALHKVTLDITAELELDALLNALARSAYDLIDADGGGAYLYEPERDVLVWTIGVGRRAAPLGTELKRGEGLAGKILESGEPLTVEDYDAWEGRADVFAGYGLQAVCGVPICWGEEFLGVFTAETSKQGAFSDEQVELLSLFAAQAAIAVKNARLYETVRRHAEELEERVTERTAELNAAYEDLQRLTRVKDEFVSNVSHELRTPIASFKLYHELLDMASPEKRADYLAALQRETNRLERIIEDLLHLSRMDQEQVALQLTPVDINGLAAEVVADRTLLAESQGLSLSLDQTPDLPPVQADRGLIGQVLGILLSNALSYTPREGQIVVKTARQTGEGGADGWIGFSVADSGPGIPPEERPHLFERFFRGEAGRRSGVPGTGLGLAIAREIVERHAGRVDLESEGIGGKGITFAVWLPLER